MKIIHSVAELRRQVMSWRAAGERVALVPTMGNLHVGHLQLVEAACCNADRVVVSIFVNPMQFSDASGNGGDFEHYPRTFDADCAKLAAADVVFSPTVDAVYPNGLDAETRVEVPGISDILCGEYRPGHFVGVATIVAKLFNMVQPDVALFGEKDFQQLLVIRRFVADLCFPVKIIGVPTHREADGLAMSSRNQYLSRDERRHASILYQTLQSAQQQLIAGERDPAVIRSRAFVQLEAAGFRPEYVEVRRKQDLRIAKESDAAEELVIIAAAWLGRARLIDNISIPLRGID
ncbi:MAG: pantoate--beta-alanine ligase [Gammaproteobacteria bacterium]|nr:pantoate--beta-alanine ligase [Gammaproteobacteria bacterium]